jgi:hypothetical protein
VTLSFLSAPGLSGGAVVCTKEGNLLAYIGGGYGYEEKLGEKECGKWQTYAYLMHGVPYIPNT